MARSFTQFGLRTALAMITVAGVCAAYFARVFDGDRYRHGFNTRLDGVSPIDVASYLREEVNKLPNHSVTDQELFVYQRKFGMAFDNMRRTTITDVIFAKVQLSDGSESMVGFWIYPARGSNLRTPQTEVSVLLLADETYFAIRSGKAALRENERAKLVRPVYSEMIYSAKLTESRHQSFE
ncbi:hypothetical protein [Anatilimnocola floriformis]|uniref:hypothetical protein n=1 Tax=Anatilimnocola floriformis TaxID=2948575 RepID=UPI0020C2E090|nr:hypothetical protein [Anatilimnocola floriformis]